MDPACLIELDGQGPRYRQIVRAVIGAIQQGRLHYGVRLPSSRRLADQLGCSRNIVILAYEQLSVEGYIATHPRRGTVVANGCASASDAPLNASDLPPEHTLSRAGVRLVDKARQARSITSWIRRARIDFMYGTCEPDPWIRTRFQRALGRALSAGAFGYGDPSGDAELRRQIADRLRSARGVNRSAAHVVVTSGAQQGLDLCARLLIERGDRVVVEDPGYEAARAVFAGAGATMVPVAVDARGVDPETLPRGRVRLIYVTPSHQFPTGAVLPQARRVALLAWAQKHESYVIEDDYDGELRYSGHAVRALSGLDRTERVIYCGTFAKALFPSIRLGYLSLPAGLVDAVRHAKWLTDRGSSMLVQRAVSELMARGGYDRHVRRMQRRYNARRLAITRALRRCVGSDVEVAGTSGGLHLVAWFSGVGADHAEAFAAACRTQGVGVYAVTPLASRPLPQAGLILGYGVVDDRLIDEGIDRIAKTYREFRSPLPPDPGTAHPAKPRRRSRPPSA